MSYANLQTRGTTKNGGIRSINEKEEKIVEWL